MLMLAVVLAGCDAFAPEPKGTPILLPFAGDEAAFAAAEATYRAYVRDLNDVDPSDPATLEDVYRWTRGAQAAEKQRSLTRLHAEGGTVGSARLDEFAGEIYAAEGEPAVLARACVEGSDVLGAAGRRDASAPVSNPTPVRITFMRDIEAPFGLRIARTVLVEGTCG
jgi:hypothetical protein